MPSIEPDPFLRTFRDYLISEELARDPIEAAPDAYPLWLEPMLGAVGPGEKDDEVEDDDDLVMSAYRRPGFSTGPWEGDTWRFDNVEIRMRTSRPTLAYGLEAQIRWHLHDRRDWDMAGIRIIESMLYLELANLGSNAQGFVFRLEYSFQRYVDEP